MSYTLHRAGELMSRTQPLLPPTRQPNIVATHAFEARPNCNIHHTGLPAAAFPRVLAAPAFTPCPFHMDQASNIFWQLHREHAHDMQTIHQNVLQLPSVACFQNTAISP